MVSLLPGGKGIDMIVSLPIVRHVVNYDRGAVFGKPINFEKIKYGLLKMGEYYRVSIKNPELCGEKGLIFFLSSSDKDKVSVKIVKNSGGGKKIVCIGPGGSIEKDFSNITQLNGFYIGSCYSQLGLSNGVPMEAMVLQVDYDSGELLFKPYGKIYYGSQHGSNQGMAIEKKSGDLKNLANGSRISFTGSPIYFETQATPCVTGDPEYRKIYIKSIEPFYFQGNLLNYYVNEENADGRGGGGSTPLSKSNTLDPQGRKVAILRCGLKIVQESDGRFTIEQAPLAKKVSYRIT